MAERHALHFVRRRRFDTGDRERTTKWILTEQSGDTYYFRNYASHKGREAFTAALELAYCRVCDHLGIPCASYVPYRYRGEDGVLTRLLPRAHNLAELYCTYIQTVWGRDRFSSLEINAASNRFMAEKIFRTLYPDAADRLLDDLTRIYWLDVVFLNTDRSLYNLVLSDPGDGPRLYAVDHTELLGHTMHGHGFEEGDWDPSDLERLIQRTTETREETEHAFVRYYKSCAPAVRRAFRTFLDALGDALPELDVEPVIRELLENRIRELRDTLLHLPHVTPERNYPLLPRSLFAGMLKALREIRSEMQTLSVLSDGTEPKHRRRTGRRPDLK